MLTSSRRDFVISTALAAAFGLSSRVVVPAAFAQGAQVPPKGFHKYMIGSAEVTALYDGIWAKPHDPAFIKNASVEETKEALQKAGLTDRIHADPPDGRGSQNRRQIHHGRCRFRRRQWQPSHASALGTMKAAGIDRGKISTILISHFHPDHVWGLMEKGTNAPSSPTPRLVVSALEYKWWTEPGRVEKLPEGRKAPPATHQ